MRASLEELLYLVMWTAESLATRRWVSLDDTFEAWAVRNRLTERLGLLARQKLVEQSPNSGSERVFRLTESGRTVALGGRDPVERWHRSWDGQWRLLIFDLPAAEYAMRTRLRRYLKQHHFGYLQNSVWLTPDPLSTARLAVATLPAAVDSLTLFEGRPCGGESDAELVSAAWPFDRIQTAYERYLHVLAQCPCHRFPSTAPEQVRLRAWALRENAAWKLAVGGDPLLPLPLHPGAYPGRRAWAERTATYARLAPTQKSI